MNRVNNAVVPGVNNALGQLQILFDTKSFGIKEFYTHLWNTFGLQTTVRRIAMSRVP